MRNVDSKAFKKAMIEAEKDTFIKLEEATSINRSTLSAIAKGEQNPSYETIAVLADALSLTYEEIGCIFFSRELTQM